MMIRALKKGDVYYITHPDYPNQAIPLTIVNYQGQLRARASNGQYEKDFGILPECLSTASELFTSPGKALAHIANKNTQDSQ